MSLTTMLQDLAQAGVACRDYLCICNTRSYTNKGVTALAS